MFTNQKKGIENINIVALGNTWERQNVNAGSLSQDKRPL